MLKDTVTQFIYNNISWFYCFDEVYIFGSVLKDNPIYNDVDLLLVYTTYNEEMLCVLDEITSLMEENFQIPFDLTVLSKKELESTNILQMIGKYIKIK